jgi:hypothetical protein
VSDQGGIRPFGRSIRAVRPLDLGEAAAGSATEGARAALASRSPLAIARAGGERGAALLVALLTMLLLSVVAAGLILNASAESAIAANFRSGFEARYAAEAVMRLAMVELAAVPDWNAALDGSRQSWLADGAPWGRRSLAGGTSVNLTEVVHLANCGRSTPCTAADMAASAPGRAWGPNNPRWRLFAYGPLSAIDPGVDMAVPYYVVVLVADDAAESDGNPDRDEPAPDAPGAGVILVRAEAFGPRGAHQAIEATIARVAGGLRTTSWHELH